MIKRVVTLPNNYSFFLFGPRQTGKTTLVQSILMQNYWSIDLLNNDLYLKYLKNPGQFKKDCLYQITQKNVRTIFVDEVQKIPRLLDEVHLLIEETKVCFILSGSSARKLKRGSANLLAGRAIQKYLFPYIYEEIKPNFDLDKELQFGTLPGIYDKDDCLKRDILHAYTQTYLKEEIMAEGIVRSLDGFSRFLDIAASFFGEIVNYSNVSRECGVSSVSVKGYYQILEDTLLGYSIYGWHKSKRKQLSFQPKFYFFDNGVVNSLNHHLKSELDVIYTGRLFEQWIMNEVRAAIYYSQSDCEMNYWRTNNNQEVDLLLSERGKIKAAIEIKSTSNPQSAHLKGLKSFNKDHPKSPCYLICKASAPFKIGNMTILPWKNFLLETLKEIL